MFRHKGKGRTFSHNLKLASILSTVAGIVNITGVLSVNTLTTNVTGHFAFFSEQLFLKNYHASITFLLFILSFLFGAFISGLLTEWNYKRKPFASYGLPLLIEASLLSAVGILSTFTTLQDPTLRLLLSFSLLFAMGLQNALVTRVSQSVVRTTHLTGLFTDLGIELSQLFFYRERSERAKLNKNIFLKMMIVSFFFLGGIIGGFSYQLLQIKTLFFAVALLCFALWYDNLLYRYYNLKRRFIHRQN